MVGSAVLDFLRRPPVLMLLAATIFVVDTVTDLPIAAAVFYVVVVLASVGLWTRRGVLAVAATCVGLTVVSFLLTRGGHYSTGLANSVISITAIAVTTYLALKAEEARAAMQDSQAQLARFARIAALGELTASIAHEVNQPLTGVVTNCNASLRWLAAQPPELVEAKAAIEDAAKDAVRAADIIARVRALVKRGPGQKEAIDLAALVEETLDLAAAEFEPGGVTVRTEFGDWLPRVEGDRVQLQQVVLNLVNNAIDAMRVAPDGPRDLMVGARREDAGHVLVTVRDTGEGLPQGEPERIFDPFYSTKPEGMGMGLAITRSIVEAHGGRIWAEPNSPRGTVVRFTLPTA